MMNLIIMLLFLTLLILFRFMKASPFQLPCHGMDQAPRMKRKKASRIKLCFLKETRFPAWKLSHSLGQVLFQLMLHMLMWMTYKFRQRLAHIWWATYKTSNGIWSLWNVDVALLFMIICFYISIRLVHFKPAKVKRLSWKSKFAWISMGLSLWNPQL